MTNDTLTTSTTNGTPKVGLLDWPAQIAEVLRQCVDLLALPQVLQAKGEQRAAFVAQQTNGISQVSVDVRHYNAVHVEVLITGIGSGNSPSATVRVLGLFAEGRGQRFPLPDANSVKVITGTDAFDCLVGANWITVEIADLRGVFSEGQGVTVYVTPYVAAGQSNVTAYLADDMSLAGQFAIDQTLPGTSNAVVVTSVGSSPTDLFEQMARDLAAVRLGMEILCNERLEP